MYESKLLTLTPQKAEKIITELCRFDTMFSDYQPACKDRCGHCELCAHRRYIIARNLTAPTACVWEVWSLDDLVGIISLTDITFRQDALAHFVFWDKRNLRGKRGLIVKAIDRYAFGKLELHRITTEVPAHMYRLRNYLINDIGFQHEGEKVEALRWKGKWENIVILGKVNSHVTR
jgi:RimJ/RimL family protein N-acetyltransferase